MSPARRDEVAAGGDTSAENPDARRHAASLAVQRVFAGGVAESVGLYQLLVESVQDYAIFALDPRGNVLSWNLGAERLKGYTRDEIVGRHFSTFYPPEVVAAGKPARSLETAARD